MLQKTNTCVVKIIYPYCSPYPSLVGLDFNKLDSALYQASKYSVILKSLAVLEKKIFK
jgi:hypothetical protein